MPTNDDRPGPVQSDLSRTEIDLTQDPANKEVMEVSDSLTSPIPVATPGGDGGSPSLEKFFEKMVKPAFDRRPVRVVASPENFARVAAALARTGRLGTVVLETGISYGTIHNWRLAYPEFDHALEEAKKIFAAALEASAYDWAMFGVCEPVFHDGKICGTVMKRSPRLLELLLKKHNPEFREGPQVQTTIQSGVLVVNAPAASEEDWLKKHSRIIDQHASPPPSVRDPVLGEDPPAAPPPSAQPPSDPDPAHDQKQG